MRIVTSTVLILTTAILLCSPLRAQVIEPTNVQTELTDRAHTAFIKKDFAKAARLYRASLDIGPLNISFANYGFALFKMGKCQAAHEAYGLAETAPKAADPPPEVVAEDLKTFRSILERDCASFLVSCPVGAETYKMEKEESRPCDGATLWRMPGRVTLRTEVDKRPYLAEVELHPRSNGPIVFKPEPIIEENTSKGITPKRGGMQAKDKFALLSGSVGLATLTGALIMEVAVLQPGIQELEETTDTEVFNERKDRLSTQQALTKGLFLGGSALVVSGIILFFLDGSAGETSAKARVEVSPQSVGISLSW